MFCYELGDCYGLHCTEASLELVHLLFKSFGEWRVIALLIHDANLLGYRSNGNYIADGVHHELSVVADGHGAL